MWTLIDRNDYYYYCGHYPQWVVEPSERGEWATEEEARQEAARRNELSDGRWRDYMNF